MSVKLKKVWHRSTKQLRIAMPRHQDTEDALLKAKDDGCAAKTKALLTPKSLALIGLLVIAAVAAIIVTTEAGKKSAAELGVELAALMEANPGVAEAMRARIAAGLQKGTGEV